MFLEEQEQLKEQYTRLVLSKLDERRTDKITAYLSAEKWDTEKFQKKIARLHWMENNVTSEQDVRAVINAVSSYDCCYVRLNSTHSFCNFAAGTLTLLSTKISQHIVLDKDFSFNPDIKFYEYKADGKESEVLDQVLILAENSFEHNRFRADNFFKKEMIDSMYSSWIKNEISNPGSLLYYVLEKGALASFLLYRQNISPLSEYKIGFVSLVASSPKFREKNYASQLLNFVMQEAKQQHSHFVIANTEGKNNSALAFFKRNGFTETASLNEYHIWN